MRKVVVTGGAGFIGLHLLSRLLERGDDVVVLDNLRRGRADHFRRVVGDHAARLIEGDVRDISGLIAASMGRDVLFHLAAQSNVLGSMTDPEYSVTTNVVGTFNVLRAAVEAKVGRVVFASSREVYGDPNSLPVGEDAPLLPKNGYGASKVAGEAYCRAVSATHGLGVNIVRLANVYGAGDRDRVIPLWLRSAYEGRDLVVYGGHQVIDFLWVGTAVDALLLAAERTFDGPVNVGSGVATTILDLAERVVRIASSKSRVVRVPAREYEVAKFVTDTRLMRSLGLRPDGDPLARLQEIAPSYSPTESPDG